MEPPVDFPFPFPPYDIQKKFMRELYTCLERANLGIFESPTGTGKSLSIICGALKWLVDHQENTKSDLLSKISELDSTIKKAASSTEDWFSVQTQQMYIQAERQRLQNKLDAILRYELKKKTLKENLEKQHDVKKKRQFKSVAAKNKERDKNKDTVKDLESQEYVFEEELVIEDDFTSTQGSEEESESPEDTFENTKIYFCSRTHSQLSQFVGELKQSPYSEIVSTVVLASRQNYCINKSLQKLKHVNLINECCLQMQRRKTTVKKEKEVKRSKVGSSCAFLPGDQESMMAKILTEIQDIEEVIRNSQEINTCPYYGTRSSARYGQLVLVPYNSILHKSTRASSGINLKDNVLIIDEAHNLLEAIEQMYSAAITGKHLLYCYNQLAQYQKRFQALFSAKSILFMSQLSFCLKKLLTAVGATTKSNASDPATGDISPTVHRVEEFEIMTEIDTINIFDLLDFIKNSKLVHKLRGFVEYHGSSLILHENTRKPKSGVSHFLKTIATKDVETEAQDAKDNLVNTEEALNNPLMAIVSFLECLKNSCADGRIFIIPGQTVGQGLIKFLLLNPASQFHDIVREARAVVLAGGTMQPMSEFIEQLFISAGAVPERIVTFSCDHVIPAENLIANVVTQGPTKVEFEFTFRNRQNTKLLDELGRALLNLCNVVPAGIVIFVPSYNYEEIVYKHLEENGMLRKIRERKHIFREPKSTSQVNQVLEEYANFIKNPKLPQNGSLLFSVVGGKLSEGLNFSDDLGRCVIIVGMPYPNVKSPELQEKMKYLDENVKSGAGNVFYENSCMKAVNQCIGRAVRHINDYSTVMLFDKRYRNKIESLPRWIQRTLVINESFGTVIGSTAKFFANKKKKSCKV